MLINYICYLTSLSLLISILIYSYVSIVSNINGVRLAAGKGPVGFINPTLYANPNAFNDITVGDIKCTTNICCQSGFVATAGWDPATGKISNLPS